MANLQQFTQSNFSTGLNTTDSTLSIKDSDLRKAFNVLYEPTGEVKSMDGLTKIGDDITVDGEPCSKVLGGCVFQKTFYLLASNGTKSRLVYLDGEEWKQANATNFDADAKAEMLVYQDQIWIVNGKATSTYVVCFLDESHNLTGIDDTPGIPEGANRIILHLERIWIGYKNQVYVSRQYPQGVLKDWDNTSVYTGANTAGLIQLDDNTEDEILQMVVHFGQLVIFREESIKIISGQTVLTSTIQKAFNSRGVYAYRSIAKADSSIYLFAPEGVKVFQGITVKEGTTQFDSVETDTIDRPIKFNIDAVKSRNLVGIAYKDKYYLSDTTNYTYIFNELTNGWSECNIMKPEFFIVNENMLYCAKGKDFSSVNTNKNANVESEIITKDFDLQNPIFYKLLHKLVVYFRTYTGNHDITISWYLDGAGEPNGSFNTIIESDAITMDGTYVLNGAIKMSNTTLNYTKKMRRNLKTANTVAIGIKASGTNRFFLNSFSLIYEVLRREIG